MRLPIEMERAGPVAKQERSTHFIFEHQVFAVPNAFFALTEDRKPALHINYGDLRAAIELRSVRKGFAISPLSPDDAMLDVVEGSLRFVRKIHPNDSIPREVLDGTASWAIDESHQRVAHSRLTLQLASWMTGERTSNIARNQIQAMASDPQVVARVQAAVSDIAAQTGLDSNQKHIILDRIENFARELSYIEAIRERFDGARTIAQKVAKLLALYKADRYVADNLTRVSALMNGPLSAFDTIFASVDQNIADVVGICRNYDQKVVTLRTTRDDLFELFMLWEPILERWKDQPIEKGKATEESVRQMFQFLARHYPQNSTWKR